MNFIMIKLYLVGSYVCTPVLANYFSSDIRINLSKFVEIIQGDQKIFMEFQERLDGWYGPNLFLNLKISCISTSFKKEISILSHIAKMLQSEKAPGITRNHGDKTFAMAKNLSIGHKATFIFHLQFFIITIVLPRSKGFRVSPFL